MKTYDVVIIGGSAAGITTAMTVRKYDATKRIAIISDVENVPIPCGIPYLFGTIFDPMKNLLPISSIVSANHIDWIVDKVTKINRDFKLVLTARNQSYEYHELVLAMGSNPLIPTIEGIQSENVYTIRKDPIYLQSIMNKLDSISRLVIIGGGFIGAEMAEECRKRNKDLEITIIEMQEHCLQMVYDSELYDKAENALRNQNITILSQEKVVKISNHNHYEVIQLDSNKTVEADMILLCIGCSANIPLAQEAGLKIGPTRSVWVDESMRTSDQSIFACGDVCEKKSFFNHKPISTKLASIATAEARIVGANIAQKKRTMSGVVGCFSTVIGGKTFSAAGLTETAAKALGYSVVIGQSESINHHPGSMPNAESLYVKLIFNQSDGVLLGGQIYGPSSAGELINAIAVMVASKSTANQLATFQFATHPALTASPIAYPIVNAAEMANQILN